MNNKIISLYVDKKLSIRDVALHLNIKLNQVYNVLRYNNIKCRTASEALKGKRCGKLSGVWFNITKKELYDLYWNKKLSCNQIAKKVGCCNATIYSRMVLYNIPKRGKRERKLLRAYRGKDNYAYGKIFYKKTNFDKELQHYVRSTWEKKVGIILKNNNIEYKYEGVTLELDDCTYTPDFIINNILIEVKGYLSKSSKEKIVNAVKKYPNYIYIFISSYNSVDKKFFNNNGIFVGLFKTNGTVCSHGKKFLLNIIDGGAC